MPRRFALARHWANRRTLKSITAGSFLVIVLSLVTINIRQGSYNEFFTETLLLQAIPQPPSSLISNDPNDLYRQSLNDSTITADKSSNNTISNGFLRKGDSLYPDHKAPNISTTPIVIKHYKLLFFGIEKVGSTVLKQLMRRMMNYSDYYHHGRGLPHVAGMNGLSYLTDYSIDEANEMMTSNEWTRAMFVRDPKERVLSAYLMWKPSTKKALYEKAKLGLLNNSDEPKRNVQRPIRKCCQLMSEGDYNWEVLCLYHMGTFSGFLDMIEQPIEAAQHNVHSTPNTTFSMSSYLRRSPSCMDKHWSPITSWRMDQKYYPTINFIGHIENAQQGVRALLNKLHPLAWETYGATGWGTNLTEAMFESATTVTHAKNTTNYLKQYYFGDQSGLHQRNNSHDGDYNTENLEERVENIYQIDYDNKYLDLDIVPLGEASNHYRKKGNIQITDK